MKVENRAKNFDEFIKEDFYWKDSRTIVGKFNKALAKREWKQLKGKSFRAAGREFVFGTIRSSSGEIEFEIKDTENKDATIRAIYHTEHGNASLQIVDSLYEIDIDRNDLNASEFYSSQQRAGIGGLNPVLNKANEYYSTNYDNFHYAGALIFAISFYFDAKDKFKINRQLARHIKDISGRAELESGVIYISYVNHRKIHAEYYKDVAVTTPDGQRFIVAQILSFKSDLSKSENDVHQIQWDHYELRQIFGNREIANEIGKNKSFDEHTDDPLEKLKYHLEKIGTVKVLDN